MHQPSFRGVVAALSRKAPELGLGATVFGARLLIAFALRHTCLHTKPTRPRNPRQRLRSTQPTQRASRHFTGDVI